MKTTNYFRNTALMLMLGFSLSFTYSQGETKDSDSTDREKKEFANAGYWIDAVVITANADKTDRDLFAGKGYFIEPVVVTCNQSGIHTSNYMTVLTNNEVSLPSALEESDDVMQVSQLNYKESR